MNNIESFTTSVGGEITFKFKDGSSASATYNGEGDKISGDSNAPQTFSATSQANIQLPKTSNITNVEQLTPSNFTTDGVKDASYKQDIGKAVNTNKPDMLACIGQKIKNIIGVFTLPFGLPLELPSVPKVNISEIFNNVGKDLKNFAIGIEKNIVGSIKGIKDSITAGIHIGDLSVSKFLGCDNVQVSSPTQKKELATSPIVQQQTTDKALANSVDNLQIKAETLVDNATSSVTTTQSEIGSITNV